MSSGAAIARPATSRLPRVNVRPVLLAEAAVLLALVSLAVTVRLTGLADPTDLSDEGIRGVQLRLLAAGFRPVSEIYASQGPLSLWLFYPAVALFGSDILVARLTVVAYSLAALAGTTWIARTVAGPLAGIVACAVLAVSPVFLDNSRLALVEVPSMAPTILGLAALFRFRRSEHRGWLVAAAILMAVGVLAKPMAAVVGLPALVMLLAPRCAALPPTLAPVRPWRRRLIDLAWFAGAGAIVCVLSVAMVGPVALYEQMVAYRLGARAVRGWDLATNLDLIVTQLRLHGWGVVLGAATGLVVAVVRRRWAALAMVGWLAFALAMLLGYSPLWEKHVTYVVPPLAILAGIGIAPLGALRSGRASLWRIVPAGPAVAALALGVTHLPTLAAETRGIVFRHAGSDMARYADDLEIVRAATTPDEFVVVDDAYLAMLTGRLTPPFLADLSWNRILARALTAEQAIVETQRFDSKVILLQDDHLGQVQRYLTWADRENVLAKSYVQRRPARLRRVYVSPAVDLGAVRESLRARLQVRTDVRIGPAALLGYAVEPRELKSGSRLDLTLMFEALQNRPPEHALITRLRDRTGETAWEGQWKIGDGSQELHTWQTGRWQAQTMRLLVDDVPAGAYILTIGLQQPKGGPARVEARSGARAWGSGFEVDLGEVLVVK